MQLSGSFSGINSEAYLKIVPEISPSIPFPAGILTENRSMLSTKEMSPAISLKIF